MPIVRYHAEQFAAGNPLLVGSHDLDVTWEEINWAAPTVGKAEHHVGVHGLFSLFESVYRTTIVWANLMESGAGRLIKSPAYAALDPSEKGSISYYLGLIFAKLFAFRILDTPWLLHFDVYGEEHDALLEGAEKPDLIGLNAAGHWIVYEAKGRTGGFSTSVLLKSGVKIAGFIRIGRKLRICTEIYAAVDQSFMELASGLQRFQLVNSMQDFLGPHHYEGRVG